HNSIPHNPSDQSSTNTPQDHHRHIDCRDVDDDHDHHALDRDDDDDYAHHHHVDHHHLDHRGVHDHDDQHDHHAAADYDHQHHQHDQHNHHDHAAGNLHRRLPHPHGVPHPDGEPRLVEYQGELLGPLPQQHCPADGLARGAVLQPPWPSPERAQLPVARSGHQLRHPR